MARPTDCTPALIKEICQVLAAGNYIETAAEYVGIGESTYYQWAKRGREELARLAEDGRRKPLKKEAIFVEFLEATTRARRSSEIRAVANIRKAGSEDWKAEAWFLEHSMPDRWGRRNVRVEHSGPDGKAIQVESSPEERRARIAELTAMLGVLDDDDA